MAVILGNLEKGTIIEIAKLDHFISYDRIKTFWPNLTCRLNSADDCGLRNMTTSCA